MGRLLCGQSDFQRICKGVWRGTEWRVSVFESTPGEYGSGEVEANFSALKKSLNLPAHIAAQGNESAASGCDGVPTY